MFACLAVQPPVVTGGRRQQPALEALLGVAREFSPRFEVHAPDVVSLDVSGLERLVGPPRAIGDELRRTAADRQIPVHVAVSACRMTAVLLARARSGLTVVAPGDEALALAPLPIGCLQAAPGGESAADVVATLRRWGIRTLGALAALPAVDLTERLGQAGLVWQRLARGEDIRPLVPTPPDIRFERSLDLDWPIDGLEPLSFVLGRLFEPLAVDLERHDRGVAVLHVRLHLVTRDVHARTLQLPTPIRDPRVLRTLALLDLESHPPPAAIDRVAIEIEPTPGRVLQFSLLARALPSAERLSTLMARLTALMGEGHAGSPRPVDSHRPGAFEMTEFTAAHDRLPTPVSPDGSAPSAIAARSGACGALRRFRVPVPARVTLAHGRPVRVTTDRRGLGGGLVQVCAGPWRSSGEWWRVTGHSPAPARRETNPAPAGVAEAGTVWVTAASGGFGGRGGARPAVRSPRPAAPAREPSLVAPARRPWNRDEWEVALSDGAAYRIFHDRDRDRWFVEGVVD